ncbi:GNAT family N-acetyltransferase [Solwaraspora sp. WMMA2080]|uniref:GNAT family N-acetyltransferase n=1 Tax=unclassified Solwaraspora TaxID=2627926 RepID=UPI00248D0FEA|nr:MULTISPECIES: GNAT family N-acetyltransferase [unclassified Solwaraspora]WBB96882.1 GNAT family N-acetyltransferase [Solwaraspora sp. WMMA2059]WBC19213.1 GNAT family N-acetyltransferase [Solwaraspora sp. WMMA2080]
MTGSDYNGVLVRPAGYADLATTARTHVEFLPVGLFPSLGAGFVRRWHRTYLDSRHGVGYVVTDPTTPGDDVVGFLLGTTDQAAHMAALFADRRTLASLAAAGAGAMARRPTLARQLPSRAVPWARQIAQRRSGQPPPSDGPADNPQVAVMIALAVRPQWRGSGIGAELVRRFVEDARRAGAVEAELVTPVGPAGATGFYERLGWELGPCWHTHDGDKLRAYRQRLVATAGG